MTFSYYKNNDADLAKEHRLHLWRLFCEGDSEGLDNLFRLYYSNLFNYGIQIIDDEGLVKDAIQEIFLKLWEKRTIISTPDSIKAYLLISVRRILLRSIKKNRKMEGRNREYYEEHYSFAFSIDELTTQNEIKTDQKTQINRAIRYLNDRQKETVFLRYHHGLTNKEISQVMNINVQSVKNNLYRALKNIRGVIESTPDLV